ncbi:MAG: hypothetical protein M3Y17_00985 [Actinomycetota bacterium]|nr:hypothetical protein [Actinomycetota bacterium]
MIAGEHSDSNGTYVALTRARERTHLYASAERLDVEDEHGGGREDRLARLAERLARSEPEVPSIAIALAHEQVVEHEHARESDPPPRRPDNDDDREEASRREAPSQRERLVAQPAQLDRARVQRDEAAVQLQHARTERDQAARVMATLPHDPQVQHALADAQDAAWQAKYAAGQAGQL